MKRLVLKKILIIFLPILCIFSFVKVEASGVYNYVDPDSELRGVWVTPVVDSALINYANEENFKMNMEKIFNVLEEYNMNTLIFHVRQMNDALYDSDINPIYTGWSKVNFDIFDPLEWLIEECHKRGIEFHAWMNPYRVKSYGATTASALAATYVNYPKNSASSEENLLVYEGKAILNPGLDAVRQHVVDTVLEFVSKYDADAVHFDDYFYIGMEANGATSGTTTILNEADNNLYIEFCENFNSLSSELKAEYTYYRSNYDVSNASHKADWRRVQCNLFFKELDEALSQFNLENNKYVQIGVAPTGIYKNGNGEVSYDSLGWPVTSGSNTGGQTHYSSYLFSDTVRWCCMSWIDYIMPQSYWATNHPTAGYYNVMNWWNKVVKNLDVNLYSGIGLYMGEESSNTYNWKNDSDELYTQLNYITTLDRVDGASIYNYAHLSKKINGETTMSAKQVANLKVNCWKNVVVQPELKSIEPIKLGKVSNFSFTGNTLTWDKLDGAKFYAIYRSEDEVTFDASELVAVVGGSSTQFEWIDSDNGEYVYGIKALSYSNTLGAETLMDTLYGIELVGASIRTTGERQGLKFIAKVETLDNVVEHGFYIAKGNHSKKDFLNAINTDNKMINGNKLVKKEVVGEKLEFNLVVYNILEEYYRQDISVLPYVKYIDSENKGNYLYEYSNTSLVRNIADVVIKAYEDGEISSFVEGIYKKVALVTFNLNGGEFLPSETFTITKYNSGSNTGTNITIGTNSNPTSATGLYWSRILVKYDSVLQLYKIVGVLPSGDALADFSKEYDYIIGAHNNCTDLEGLATINSIISKADILDYYLQFTAPTTTDCNILVKLIHEKFATNKIKLDKGESLPSAAKEDLIFMGWYKNSEFTGEPVTKWDGVTMEFFAKFIEEYPTYVINDYDALVLNNHIDIIVNPMFATEIFKLNNQQLNDNFKNKEYQLGVNAFKTINEAILNATDDQKIYVFSGTYNEDLTIDKSISLLGSNYNISVNSVRNDESIINGKFIIKANNININGIKITGGTNSDILAPISLDEVSNFKLEYSIIDSLYGTIDSTIYGNNRRPAIAQYSNKLSTDIIISNNKFIYTNHTSLYLKYVVAFNNVNNFTFSNNIIETSSNDVKLFYLYNSSGNILVKGNSEGFSYTNAGSGTLITE